MALVAILDASVLYPLPLRDTLLRIAETGCYDPCWSERILGEMTRNLIAKRGATDTQTEGLLDAMRQAFDTATVPEQAIARLEPAMTNNPKDRHVLATAAVANAQVIVTLNLKHFPSSACEPLAVEPVHPDAFLLDLYSLDPDMALDAVARQATALPRPPMTVDELLDRLAATVPNFAQALRTDRP
ncbi:MAG: PIN domain-containing protein [Solirubrobacterales bacterium]